jgi:cell division protein FtsB
MIGAGVSFALDKTVKPVGGAAAAEIKSLKAENAEIKAELAELKAAIKAMKEAK